MLDFTGKKVLITGGSRGIGAATAKLFARLNADVSLNYHSNKNAADAILRELKKYNGRFLVEQCDVADPVQIDQFINNTLKQFSRIDILVNNAGIWEQSAIEQMRYEDWRRTMQINLDSVFHFTQRIVAIMKTTQTKGKIINIASTAGQRGEAFHSHYAASKGAMISFTKSLASELGPEGILVNCVAPGWVETDMSHEAIQNEGEKVLSLIPLKKIPAADEIAGPIVFLASDWASAITGEILNVNSGSVLCG
jgi:3-oxoacyl-[acyl-carrier protein] reductase